MDFASALNAFLSHPVTTTGQAGIEALNAIDYATQNRKVPFAPVAPAAPPPVDTRLQQLGQMLGGQDQGSSVDLGSAGVAPTVAPPQLTMPDYSQADAAYAAGKPHPISAPQYVQPDYTKADSLWSQARPAPVDQSELDNAKYGDIISGAAKAFLSAPQHKGMAMIMGALGGYGQSIGDRAKMTSDQADKTAEYLLKDAGYESGKAGDMATTANQQGTANYNADRTNQSSLESYGEALGGYQSRKATEKSDIINKQAELGFQANTRNADINANKKGVKVIGQNKNDIIYSYIDDKGNLNIATKPIDSFAGANGKLQGKLAGNDPGGAGMETLINTLRSGGALEKLLGPAYAGLVKSEKDYSDPTGPLGGLSMLGDKGKAEAMQRSIQNENAAISQYLMEHPDLLAQGLDAVMGSQQ